MLKWKRILCVILTLILCLGLCPAVNAKASQTLGQTELLNVIETQYKREYVQKMLDYYLNTYQELKQAMDGGEKPVLFMFEGGSDSTSPYGEYSGVRDRAVAIIARGWNIVYISENCSTIPDHPYTKYYVAPSSATILDGIYRTETVTHNGYAGLHVLTMAGSGSIPCIRMDRSRQCYVTSPLATGIDIHTRSVNTCGTDDTKYNSTGCLNIESKSDGYPAFLNAYVGSSPYPGTWSASMQYKDAGFVVVDRLLAAEELKGLYTYSGTVEAMTAFSKAAEAACASPETLGAEMSALQISADALGVVNRGCGRNIIGAVSSNYPISSVTGEFLRDGQVVQSETIRPGTVSVDLKYSAINNNLRFGILSSGAYVLRLTAEDLSGKTVSTSVPFTVKGASDPEIPAEPVIPAEPEIPTESEPELPPAPASELAVSVSLPETITLGKSCNISGSVKSNYDITGACGQIVDEAGNVLQSVTAAPAGTELDILHSDINLKLRFGILQAGNYTLAITAEDASGMKVTENKAFRIQSPSDIRFAVDPIGPVNRGSSYNITGSVTSSQKLSSVKGEFLNASGAVLQTVTVYPNGTSLDIKPCNINQLMRFGTLAAGSYTFRLTAKDALGYSAVESVPFTVRETSALKVSLGAISSIPKGRGCNVTGTVSSNSNVQNVTGEILSGSTVLQTVSVTPNAKSLDLKYSAINMNLLFGALARGTYTLRVTAVDALGETKASTVTFTVY